MPESLTVISAFIKDVGFPIFVGVYVLMRMEPAITKLTIAIIQLKEVIDTKMLRS